MIRAIGLRGLNAKSREEIDNWQRRLANEGNLENDWYRFYYTEHFGIRPEFFHRKRIVDIGCGPRGSLEWADSAAVRVGVDPLAHRYLEFGTRAHSMSYVAGSGERLPLLDSSADVVSSFNSLDHTDELEAVIQEIIRILRVGGTFLLLVDINHKATDSEPHTLSWDVTDRFGPDLELVAAKHYEHAGGVYQSVWKAETFDHGRGSDRPGVLSARFRKVAGR